MQNLGHQWGIFSHPIHHVSLCGNSPCAVVCPRTHHTLGQHSPEEVDTPVLTTAGLWGTFFFTPYAAREEPLSRGTRVGGRLPATEKQLD